MDSEIVKKTLFDAVLALKDESELKDFFSDLCTEKEVENMAYRFYVAKLLSMGYTYEHVIAETGISSAILSRVSKLVQNGKWFSKAGGVVPKNKTKK